MPVNLKHAGVFADSSTAWYGFSPQLVLRGTPSSSPDALSEPLGNSFEPQKEPQEVEGDEVYSNASDSAEKDTGTLYHGQDVVVGHDSHGVPSLSSWS